MFWLISELVGWVHIFELFDEDLKNIPMEKIKNGKKITEPKRLNKWADTVALYCISLL